MEHITFVVKGTEQQAREQMFVRGIIAKTIGFTRTDTVFSADLSYRDKVAEWFGQYDELVVGVGYSSGTCLIYSTHSN